jgi:hypothetical protein
MAQLEIHHRVSGGQWIRQKTLEPLQLLLGTEDCALLLLQLVEQLETFPP